MAAPKETRLAISVDTKTKVSALMLMPAAAKACLVLAHGAGAGMEHPFLQAVAEGFAARGIATLRYQFPYMEQGSKRPDRPALAIATIRAAVDEAGRQMPSLPLFAGGKSFGGRMSSQAQAEAPLASVQGLVFLGFPLHAAGKPSAERGDHLAKIAIPMLFLQGTRDALADLSLLQPLVKKLGATATLLEFEGADHSFHVLKKSGRTDVEVLNDLLDKASDWMIAHL